MALVTGAATAAEVLRPDVYPPRASVDEIRACIERAPKAHPRLLVGADTFAAVRDRVQRDPLCARLAQTVCREAETLLAVLPVRRQLEGRRLLGQSREALKRVTFLAMAYHLSGERRFAERAAAEMRAAAAFSDWNPSHYLDVAEMTMALALGYDWLYEQLDPESRPLIRDAILEKGVRLPETTKHTGWVRATNNWGQVCHGGMVAGALATLEDEPDLAARTVHRAIQNVTVSMAVYAPKGSYPEGPGYWSYGTTYNVLLLAELESALGTDFGLAAGPGFALTGDYINLVSGPSGLGFNYADGGAGRGPEPALHWLARRFDRPDWVTADRKLLDAGLDRPRGRDRCFPLFLLWLVDGQVPDDRRALPLHWEGRGRVPVTVHRSSWTDPNATFVGLKGGSPSANHGQMDIGSFVLDADGVRWAVDLGAEGYHGIESRGMNLWSSAQNSDRWKIFRQSNQGHNTLVVDGQPQVAAGSAPVVAFSDNPRSAFSVLDLTKVYAGQAAAIHRGVALLSSGEVLVRDRLTGLRPGALVRWQMITEGKPAEPLGGDTIVLGRGDRRLTLSALLLPAGVAWATADTAKPRAEWDSPNPGTVMALLEVTAPASGIVDFAVLATPGSCTGSLRQSLDLRPPQDWPQPRS